MFTVSCAHCGSQHSQDETRVPPSGIVIKCPTCGKAVIVMPPKPEDIVASPAGKRPAAETDMGLGPKRAPAAAPSGKLAAGPALAAFDADDDGGELAADDLQEIVDLPAPKGPHPDIIDLPAPKMQFEDIVDLPAPKGPTPSRMAPAEMDLPDLLVPVGPTPTKGGLDLPAPVGPYPTKGAAGADYPQPVGPYPTKGAAGA